MCASGVLRKSPVKFFIWANFCKNLGGIRANFCKDLGGICNKNPGKTLWSWCLFVIKCAFRAYGKQLNNVLNVHQLTKKNGHSPDNFPQMPEDPGAPRFNRATQLQCVFRECMYAISLVANATPLVAIKTFVWYQYYWCRWFYWLLGHHAIKAGSLPSVVELHLWHSVWIEGGRASIGVSEDKIKPAWLPMSVVHICRYIWWMMKCLHWELSFNQQVVFMFTRILILNDCAL